MNVRVNDILELYSRNGYIYSKITGYAIHDK
jgi:hypothetical protein